MAAMEAPKEALADAAGDGMSTTAPAVAATAAHHDPHRPQRIVASHPAPTQRNAMASRDRFNHQSLGASLNSLVKHVRLVTSRELPAAPCPNLPWKSSFYLRSNSFPSSYDLFDFFSTSFPRMQLLDTNFSPRREC